MNYCEPSDAETATCAHVGVTCCSGRPQLWDLVSDYERFNVPRKSPAAYRDDNPEESAATSDEDSAESPSGSESDDSILGASGNAC